jgi:3',5'-cyclic-AMP phosphodiesterase
MPLILDSTLDRRDFLRFSAAGFLALSLAATAAPEASAGALRLALLADTHIPADRVSGSRGFNAYEHLKSIIPSIIDSQADGMVIAGDAARLTGELDDYTAVLELLEPLAPHMPAYIALGNHDNRENFFERVQELHGARQPVEKHHVTLIEHPATRVLVLDSLLHVRKSPGHLGKAQREWLSAYLAAHTDRPVVLVFHHTLGENDSDLLDTDRLFTLLAPHPHVRAIFHGHSHRWQRYELQGIQIINLPAVGHIWTPEQPLGWVSAEFRQDGMRLTLNAFSGNREEDGKVFDYSWT